MEWTLDTMALPVPETKQKGSHRTCSPLRLPSGSDSERYAGLCDRDALWEINQRVLVVLWPE